MISQSSLETLSHSVFPNLFLFCSRSLPQLLSLVISLSLSKFILRSLSLISSSLFLAISRSRALPDLFRALFFSIYLFLSLNFSPVPISLSLAFSLDFSLPSLLLASSLSVDVDFLVSSSISISQALFLTPLSLRHSFSCDLSLSLSLSFSPGLTRSLSPISPLISLSSFPVSVRSLCTNHSLLLFQFLFLSPSLPPALVISLALVFSLSFVVSSNLSLSLSCNLSLKSSLSVLFSRAPSFSLTLSLSIFPSLLHSLFISGALCFSLILPLFRSFSRSPPLRRWCLFLLIPL